MTTAGFGVTRGTGLGFCAAPLPTSPFRGLHMPRILIVLAVISLVATACGRGGETEVLSTTATSSPTITASTVGTSTSSQPTTTTGAARVLVTTNLSGADDNALAASIAAVYKVALNPGQSIFLDLPQGLLDQFADRTPTLDPLKIEGEVFRGLVLETEIAVAVIGADVVLAVQTAPDQWNIVGAKLTSLGEPAWYGDDVTQILVIGSDARPGGKVEGHRADSVHIVSTIPATGTASIVGIPRDSWVAVTYEGYGEVNGMDKLTHTMASKGPEVVVETVTNLSGVELDGYLLTGFAGFEDLIDAFGGVTVDVPYRMNDIKSFSNLYPGEQVLNGSDALAFSRNRANAPGGDFGRSFNHGVMMKSVLFDMQDRGSVEQIPMLLSILMEFVQTDMTAAQLLNMAAATFEVDSATVENIVLPGMTGWRSGRNVVILADEAYEIFTDIAQDGILEIVAEEDEG